MSREKNNSGFARETLLTLHTPRRVEMSEQTTELARRIDLAPAPMREVLRGGEFLRPTSLKETQELAAIFAASGLIPEALWDRPNDVFIVVGVGLELGLSPFQALRGIHVFDGKVILAADLLVGLVKRSPECVYFELLETTGEQATYETQRKGERPTKISWTLEQARKADLLHKKNWKHTPEAMLRHRCAASLARAVYPDIALGLYTEDEGEDIRQSRAAKIESAPRAPRSLPAPSPAREEEGERAQPLPAKALEPIDRDPNHPRAKEIEPIDRGLDVAQTKEHLRICADQLRALELGEGDPERLRLVKRLHAVAKMLGIQPEPPKKKEPPKPVEPAEPSLREPGADEDIDDEPPQEGLRELQEAPPPLPPEEPAIPAEASKAEEPPKAAAKGKKKPKPFTEAERVRQEESNLELLETQARLAKKASPEFDHATINKFHHALKAATGPDTCDQLEGQLSTLTADLTLTQAGAEAIRALIDMRRGQFGGQS